MDPDRFRINAPLAVSEFIDGEAVIMNLESGHYFSGRGLAGVLWEATIMGTSRAEMAIAVSAAWNMPIPNQDVDAFLDQLLEHSLIVPSDGAVAPDQRAALVAALGTLANSVYQAPRLEVFTDMEDLLLLDPIHDVGEAGWPTPRADDTSGPP